MATGLYAIGICYFFDPFILAKTEASFNLVSSIGVLSFTIAFAILRLTINLKREKSILYFSVFVLALTIPAIISWFFLNAQGEFFILYITAFFIASIPPTVLVLIWSVLPRILNNPLPIEPTQIAEEYFEIRNSKNKLIFKSEINRIIQFEANDNYCITHYLDKDDNYNKSMDRISLKAVQDKISGKSASFFRVHKSHIINTKFIDKIGGKSQSHKITMKHSNIESPVSRTFDISQLEQ